MLSWERQVQLRGLALDVLTLLLFVALMAGLSGARPALGQPVTLPDPATLFPGEADLPAGFEHQPQYDVALDEGPVLRLYRFYTRGTPEVPTEEHASILIGVAVNETVERAAIDFHDTVASWSRMGYGLSSLNVELGDEAVAGWDGVAAGSEYPKRGALVLARFGAIIAAVQWTDDPSKVTLDEVVTIARLIEERAYLSELG